MAYYSVKDRLLHLNMWPFGVQNDAFCIMLHLLRRFVLNVLARRAAVGAYPWRRCLISGSHSPKEMVEPEHGLP